MTWRLEAGPHGAPVAAVAAGVRRAISLTHCRTVVACAIAERGPVGIDIEAIDPRRPITAITSAAFGPAERAAVECGGIETFYRIWTLREAYAKATGRGFAALVDGRDLPPIGVEADDTPAREHWCFASRRLPQGFWLGCAVLGEGGDVDEPEEV